MYFDPRYVLIYHHYDTKQMTATQNRTRRTWTREWKTAHGIVGSSLLNLDSVYADRVQEKASCIAADLTLPVN